MDALDDALTGLAERFNSLEVSTGDPVRPLRESDAAKPPPTHGTQSFDYLFQRLVTEKEPLVFLGESPTRALSVSFAVMRGSLKNIWATRYNVEGDTFWSRSNFPGYIEQSRARGKANARLLWEYWRLTNDTDTKYDKFIERCKSSSTEMDRLPNFALSADARHLLGFFNRYNLHHLPQKHIFFQCPWNGVVTGYLLQDTLRSAAHIQKPGDLLLFGLIETRLEAYGSNITQFRKELYAKYEIAYRVSALQSCALEYGYKPLNKDQDLIKRCFFFGYHHWTEAPWDLNHYMIQHNELVIYTFVKMQVVG
ncbi:hypothetical protein C8R43DRAFT_1107972 [Mycena crocata]|nr:hypothetical protein C8R43DRAFT_1107972 [Mycena crocata]